MQKLDFNVDKDCELTKAIIDKLPFFSRFDVQKILKNKDVKVNNKRVFSNIFLKSGSLVEVYYTAKTQKEWFEVVYYDDNILIVNKRAGIEVVSETERDLISFVKQDFKTAVAVHRIDRLTEGLVIFALNSTSEKELLSAFKTRKGIIKKYALLVNGRVDLTKIKRTVYLKKLENLSKVWISEVPTSGFDAVKTEFEIIEYQNNKTLLEANLITGKTHQIRAHIAYYGYPICGDKKYGKDDEKQLHLTAHSLSFNFNKKSPLNYLNAKNFEITPTWLH